VLTNFELNRQMLGNFLWQKLSYAALSAALWGYNRTKYFFNKFPKIYCNFIQNMVLLYYRKRSDKLKAAACLSGYPERSILLGINAGKTEPAIK